MIENCRITATEAASLPESVREHINSAYKPESEWIEIIRQGEVTEKTRRMIFIPVWDENIDTLEDMHPGVVINQIVDNDNRSRGSLPSLEELADQYGEPEGNKLYALRDLEWKWTDYFLREHPDVDPSASFSDLRACVMRK